MPLKPRPPKIFHTAVMPPKGEYTKLDDLAVCGPVTFLKVHRDYWSVLGLTKDVLPSESQELMLGNGIDFGPGGDDPKPK